MKYSYILIVFMAVLFTACDEDVVGPSGFTYSTTSFAIDFWTSGQTGSPTINWNGSTGMFGLAESYDGVSIDANTGIVSWNKGLPLGVNSISVIATNANGNVSKTIELDHTFSGVFIGSYNYDPGVTPSPGTNYTLDFGADGSLQATDFTTPSVSGSYTINEETLEILGEYTYATDPIYIEGTLSYSNAATPEINGVWGNTETNPNTGAYRVFYD